MVYFWVGLTSCPLLLQAHSETFHSSQSLLSVWQSSCSFLSPSTCDQLWSHPSRGLYLVVATTAREVNASSSLVSWIMSPKGSHLQNPWICILFGKRDFNNVIKLVSWDGDVTLDYPVGLMTSQGYWWEEVRGSELEKEMWTGRQRSEWCNHKLRIMSSLQKLEKARSIFFPRASRKSTALLEPRFWTSESDFRLLTSAIVRW